MRIGGCEKQFLDRRALPLGELSRPFFHSATDNATG
jgi:hypothetical protein